MERARPIERLADALQACLNEAAERGAQRVKEEAERNTRLAAQQFKEEAERNTRLAAQQFREKAERTADRAAERAAQRVKEELVPRLDRQDETLRLIWKQVKGSGRLPIDE